MRAPSSAPLSRIVIISPALRKANNGNWQTAHRWAGFLRDGYGVGVADGWAPQANARGRPACMIALHARRSADAIARFADTCPGRPLALVLTGTDLYRDIHVDPSARRSLDLATHLVVLQPCGLNELAPAHRAKCRVIFQSAAALRPGTPNRRTFDVVMVGHMRPEKDPLTPMRALERLPDDSRVRLIHIGAALQPEYQAAAQALQARHWPVQPRYVWYPGMPHDRVRQRIRRARAMVISSVMEGGANVIVESVTAGVPVLASRISGNVGMLGEDYAGYFPPGDSDRLAQLLERASRDDAWLDTLRRQCARRAPLFVPARERAEVIKLVADALTFSRTSL